MMPMMFHHVAATKIVITIVTIVAEIPGLKKSCCVSFPVPWTITFGIVSTVRINPYRLVIPAVKAKRGQGVPQIAGSPTSSVSG